MHEKSPGALLYRGFYTHDLGGVAVCAGEY